MMMLVTLDLETYYDRDYSLSKISTEAYVRDPRFEVIGISIKIDDEPTRWYPQPQERAAIDAIDWSEAFVLAQNTMFDYAILAWHYGVRAKGLFDTMSMSRAMHPHAKSHSLATQAKREEIGVKGDEVVHALGKRYADFDPESLARYGAYCCNDTELTYTLFQRYMERGFPTLELRLIDLTIRMFAEPVLRLDAPLLIKHLREVRARKATLLETLSAQLAQPGVDLKSQLMSNPQFATLLRSCGVEPPMKVSPTTGKQTYAFAKSDEEFIALSEHWDERVQALVAARLGNKSTLEETRTERFIEMAGRGVFPVPLRYYGAHSSRWAGVDGVNLQNLPSRDPKGKALKYAILPPERHVVIEADSAQIECRVLAWLAGQEDLLQAFRDKADVYRRMASQIYGVDPQEVSKQQRQVGKVVVLGCGFGVSHVKLRGFLKVQAGVEVDESEARRIIDTYRTTNHHIVDLWKRADTALNYLHGGMTYRVDVNGIVIVAPGKGLTMPNGLHIQYPGLQRKADDAGKVGWVYESKGEPRYIYGGKVVENCIAGGTEVLTDRGWVSIEKVRRSDRVHDGVEFVEHGGVVFKSIQACVTVDGVAMTPDHEVLTDDGWKAASQVQRPYRPDLRHVDCTEPGVLSRQGVGVALSVPVREEHCEAGQGCDQGSQAGRHAELRLRDGTPHLREESDARHEPASGVRGVALDGRPLHPTYASGVEKLRGARHIGLRAVATIVRSVLGGYGGYVRSGLGLGPHQQRWPVLAGELPVDHSAGERHEQAQHRASRRCSCVESRDGDRDNYLVLPTGARVAAERFDQATASEAPVYDIVNAGPRTRFVVRGTSGPFIVHNCTQYIARCVVAEQMLRIARRYTVVLTVHDSVVAVAPAEQATQAAQYIEECMRWVPAWANGLPLSCEVGVGESYGAC